MVRLNSYLVAIVSNQGGISLKPDPKTVKSDQKRLADFKGKLSAVLTQLELPISVYAATARDHYRKPRTGIWQELLDDHDLDGPASVDLENSFFVGDAGGREAAAGGAVKDHSCVDRCANSNYALLMLRVLTLYRDFAANVGLTYHTPEEYFLHEESRPFVRDFDPLLYMKEWGERPMSARTFEILAHVRRCTNLL
jgi:bifunctional polynucleotide phosphatase/kinase